MKESSFIAYVQLRDANGKLVFEFKKKLTEGDSVMLRTKNFTVIDHNGATRLTERKDKRG